MYRYMLGCSGGGRMTEQAIERYPDDFDGAVVGAPGLGWDPSWFTWTTQQIFRTPNAWVSPAKLALIERTVIKQCASPNGLVADPDSCGFDPARSEEHTSELQSLMRISYAVFCLKKKTHIIAHAYHT